jgi:hypothetical protein
MTSRLDTPEGVFPLEVWRYEKRLERVNVIPPAPR